MGKDRSIFYSSSFFSLSPVEKKVVRDYVEASSIDALPRIDTTEIFRHQLLLNSPLDYYAKKIKRVNPVSFKYMTFEQRRVLEEELMFACYIFSARYQLDHVEKRGRALSNRAEQIKNCAFLINTLRTTPPIGEKNDFKQQLAQEVRDADTPVKYLAMQTISPFILDVYKDISDGKIQTWLDVMSAFNERRLYWVWAGGGGLLGAILKLIADDFYNKSQAEYILGMPAPITGGLSWILYYIRFGIRAGLFARHVVPNKWMSQEESDIPMYERFMMQWRQRKFYLLNDFFWAGANLATFFWLVGEGLPGYYGGVLTGILLTMDVGITIWGFKEEKAQYDQDMARYKADISTLVGKKTEIQQPLLDQQINELIKARRQCKLDWDYKLYTLFNDAMYAISLFCAFALVCCCFFPPAAVVPATALICGVIGTVLCFTFNAFFAAVRKGLEVSKSVEVKNYNTSDKILLLKHYKTLDNEFDKKQCYLDYKLLVEESAAYQEVIVYQKMVMLRAVLIDLLVPPVFFMGLVLLPLGIGIPVIACAFALAVWSSYYVDAEYKPKGEVELPGFDEDAFASFDAEGELSLVTAQEFPQGFFGVVSDSLRVNEVDPLFLNSSPDAT